MKKESGKRLAGGTPKPASRLLDKDQAKPHAGAAGTRKKARRLTWQQIVLIVIVVLLALALIGVLVWRSLFVRPDLPGSGTNTPPSSGDSGAQSGDAPNISQSGIDYGDGIRPRADGERKSQDYYTVLILGRDTGGGGNTDTMLLASYDVTNQKATVMSIPRDTMVNIPYDIKRINAVYNYNGQGEKGIKALYKEISQLVGFEPDYQVIVEWEAVGKIVDAMGGVYYDVPRDMNYDDRFQDLHIHQAKGYRLLSGDDAMQVLRYRHDNGNKRGYADGDIGRIATQQGLLKAMVQQLLQLKNIGKVQELAKVFQECVETDLSFQNILWFAKSAYLGGLKVDDVNFVTMPGNYNASAYSRTVGNNQSYVTPYAKQLLELVNNELSPFKEVFTLKDLDIMSVNRDGSLSSTTGYVEDRKAASPPVRPVKDPEPAEEEDPPETDENGNPIDPETGEPIDTTPSGEGEGNSSNSPNGSGSNNSSNSPSTPSETTPSDPTVIITVPGDTQDPPEQDPNAPASGSTTTPEPAPSEGSDPTPPEPDVQEPTPPPEVPSDPGFVMIEPPPEA